MLQGQQLQEQAPAGFQPGNGQVKREGQPTNHATEDSGKYRRSPVFSPRMRFLPVTGVTGELTHARYLIHDRDTKFTEGFDQILHGAGIEAIKLPPRSPNLNAYAECWIRSLKSECLEHLILFGERSLAHVLHEYLAHHQQERNHQGLDNVIPFPDERLRSETGPITKSERLGGLLQFYYRKAA
jgi:hypothetical protein